MTSSAGGHPPLVLIANDQEWSSRSLESILAPRGFAVLKAYTGRQALELCRTVPIDAVIADHTLSDMTGVRLCERLRSEVLTGVAIPVVMTASGSDGREERLEAYRAGAWEYCTQPFDAEMLLLKLENFVRAKREADRVRDNSMLDEITGLYSARGLSRRAREIGAEAVRRHAPLACIAVGVEEGSDYVPAPGADDRATRLAMHLSDVFKRTGRMSDAIGRVGQSEFAIIAPATEAKGALRLVERLRASVEAELAGSTLAQPGVLRAGYHAVDDLATSTLDVEDILMRAVAALRRARTADSPRSTTAFTDINLS